MAKYLERLVERARIDGRQTTNYSEQAAVAERSAPGALDDPFENTAAELPGEHAESDRAQPAQILPGESHPKIDAVRPQTGISDFVPRETEQPKPTQTSPLQSPTVQPVASAEGLVSDSSILEKTPIFSDTDDREETVVEMTATSVEQSPPAQKTALPADDLQIQELEIPGDDNSGIADLAAVENLRVNRSEVQPEARSAIDLTRNSDPDQTPNSTDSVSSDSSEPVLKTIERLLSPDSGRERPTKIAAKSAHQESNTVSIGAITVELTPPTPQPVALRQKAPSRSSLARGRSAARSRNSFGLGQV
jgi:hypothetical protein